MFSKLETIITAVVTTFFALATSGNFAPIHLPATLSVGKNLLLEVVEAPQNNCDPAPPVKNTAR
ncbi:MAG: hypothetical protein SAL07_05055 [Oscillatoria sp. PMC 1051.18]|uniref:hypothetical protein n=1 Tax=Oscillatoria salina TaxID=331517 RepID=UPI0013BDE15D|nr:hypothetical protein [Oscillatoria salina]MBZ8179750.1 hypothetical protein [Oscillatoria salina IIICB1]MEC4892766.1 hypothetical protein [Oscillatoria sp. PMC 1050.18]MEC5029261.1 hypothetical protein [Oscillatoria sp. PMC 1051.18]NET87147.1 hypothetical protein [Kamptonema sp. SIO1D9]